MVKVDLCGPTLSFACFFAPLHPFPTPLASYSLTHTFFHHATTWKGQWRWFTILSSLKGALYSPPHTNKQQVFPPPPTHPLRKAVHFIRDRPRGVPLFDELDQACWRQSV